MSIEILQTIAMLCALHTGADNPMMINHTQNVQYLCQKKLMECTLDVLIKKKKVDANVITACHLSKD